MNASMNDCVPTYGIVDLFAGPGGLAEGFSRVATPESRKPFKIVMSVEKDQHAHATLRLRAFFRAFSGSVPQDYYQFLNGEIDLNALTSAYPDQWKAAETEAVHMTLGDETRRDDLNKRLIAARESFEGRTILIGGPPCQAYSLAGRVRNKGNSDYEPREDKRHYLYKEFLCALETLRPVAFVMENVKGMLSSSIDGSLISRQILGDLRTACEGYELFPLTPVTKMQDQPKDFLVRSENHGVPQKRHRVIIVGIRADLANSNKRHLENCLTLDHSDTSTVRQVIGNLPPQRSLISRRRTYTTTWVDIVRSGAESLERDLLEIDPDLSERFAGIAEALRKAPDEVQDWKAGDGEGALSNSLASWLFDGRIKEPTCVESRGHMPSDLVRYLFAAAYAEVHGSSPKATDFPDTLAPAHKNWTSGSFNDRFRVQVASKPSTTITSHISKDGHYYIHPDPMQCRSLTVREAARLQTFPDNYLFLGPRTSQYHQVGNAVPPYLAEQIGSRLVRALGLVEKTCRENQLSNSNLREDGALLFETFHQRHKMG